MRRQINTIAVPYTPLVNRLMLACCFGIAFSLFLYGIFLLLAVSHTAARVEAKSQIEKLSSSVSALEMEYLTKTKELTPERAELLGFVPTTEVTTVFRTAAARSFGYTASPTLTSLNTQ